MRRHLPRQSKFPEWSSLTSFVSISLPFDESLAESNQQAVIRILQPVLDTTASEMERNCVGGNTSLAESGNFSNPKLTGNYCDCVYETTGSTISPDLTPWGSLSQGRTLSWVVIRFNSMRRRAGRVRLFVGSRCGY